MSENEKRKLSSEDPIILYEMVLMDIIPKFPTDIFTKRENCIKITRYLIEERLEFTDEDIYENLDVELFKNNRLKGLLRVYHTSPYDIINDAYPGKYKPWLFRKVSNKYWTEETAREATKWLIEEKLKFTQKDIYEKLSTEHFRQYGLRSMVQRIYGDNMYKVAESVYPGEYKAWLFSKVPNGYWTEETAGEAIQWLIEEKLKFTEEEVYGKLDKTVFVENGLGGMVHVKYSNNIYKAVCETSKGKYKPWLFSKVPSKYWTEETAKVAIKWLVEEKLGFSEEDAYKKLSKTEFIENGLGSMLNKLYKGNIHKALEATYSGIK